MAGVVTGAGPGHPDLLDAGDGSPVTRSSIARSSRLVSPKRDPRLPVETSIAGGRPLIGSAAARSEQRAVGGVERGGRRSVASGEGIRERRRSPLRSRLPSSERLSRGCCKNVAALRCGCNLSRRGRARPLARAGAAQAAARQAWPPRTRRGRTARSVPAHPRSPPPSPTGRVRALRRHGSPPPREERERIEHVLRILVLRRDRKEVPACLLGPVEVALRERHRRSSPSARISHHTQPASRPISSARSTIATARSRFPVSHSSPPRLPIACNSPMRSPSASNTARLSSQRRRTRVEVAVLPGDDAEPELGICGSDRVAGLARELAVPLVLQARGIPLLLHVEARRVVARRAGSQEQVGAFRVREQLLVPALALCDRVHDPEVLERECEAQPQLDVVSSAQSSAARRLCCSATTSSGRCTPFPSDSTERFADSASRR